MMDELKPEVKLSAIERALRGKGRSNVPEGSQSSDDARANETSSAGSRKERRKPLNTQELHNYASEQNIEIASDSALKNCGVLFPGKNEIISFAPPSADEVPQAGEEISFAPPMVQDRIITQETIFDSREISPATDASTCAWAAPPAPAVADEQPSLAPPVVQEAPITFQSSYSAPPNMPEMPAYNYDSFSFEHDPASAASDGLQSGEIAHPYFTGAPERQTYTAELRFRSQFSSQQEAQLPEPELAPPVVSEEKWNSVQDFSPSEDSESSGVSLHPSINMLDVLDSRYESVPSSGAPQQFVPSSPVEVKVEYSQTDSRLSSTPGGLAGGLNVQSKRGQGKGKNRWS
ncbi:MAG TPA: hypothetical protein VFA15_00740, partial [Nitrososphaera sp.]|nr:hypothetical protein [Nitrososphaera sp.]